MKKSFKKLATKGVSLLTAAALAGSMVIPAVASADDTKWVAPKSETSLTKEINGKTFRYETSAGIFGSNIAAEYLGLSNVVDNQNNTLGRATDENYESNSSLGVWGSEANENPDPYAANVFYNFSVKAGGGTQSDNAMILFQPTSQGNGTIVEDTTGTDEYGTCTTLARRPDIITQRPATTAFTTQIEEINKFKDNDSQYYKAKSDTYVGDENYNPLIGTYNSTSVYTLVESLYSLATAANTTIEQAAKQGVNLTTRYGDPEKIATKAQKLIRGMQYYVQSKIADGTVQEKTVAFVKSATDENNIVLQANIDPSKYFGGSTHTLEGLVPITKNLANVLDPSLEVGETALTYTCTAKELAQADVIMMASPDNGGPNFTGPTTEKETLVSSLQDYVKDAGNTKLAQQPIYWCNPVGTTGLGQMQIDTLIVTMNSMAFAYPELFNTVDFLAYYYQNFYHIKSSYLGTAVSTLAKDMSLPSGVTLDTSNYSASKVENILNAGMDYYLANKTSIINKHDYMEASAELESAYKAEQPKTIKIGTVVTVGKAKVKKTSETAVAYVKSTAKSAKSISVPATVKLADGKTYKVTAVNAKAFNGCKAKKITVGKNVKVIYKNAFKGSKAKKITIGAGVKKIKAKAFNGFKAKKLKLVVKSKKLKKSTVKKCFKGSKAKKVTVKAPKSKLKVYKKAFTKKNTKAKKIVVKK